MSFKLKNIFGENKKEATKSTDFSQQLSLALSGSDLRNTNESYVDYGKRLCGQSNANVDNLPIYFQKVCQSEKIRYINNETRQATVKEKKKAELINKQSEKQVEENNLQEVQCKIDGVSDRIRETKGEIKALKAGDKSNNKEAAVKFYFGMGILALLTIYLFIFYSSTFYSAFFGNGAIEDISDAMFSTNALSQASAKGFGPLIFVCTAPVIFMALGYALHYFSIKKGVGRYFKTAGCVGITLIFDCLLAYSIAKMAYEFVRINSTKAMPEYNMSAAINDVNVWIVIFCGFITYMIWGIVLDMVLSAYGDFKSNTNTLVRLNNEIVSLQSQKSVLEAKLSEIKNKIADLEGEIKKIENSLNHVTYPISEIKRALADFFSGWATLAAVLSPAGYNTDKAKATYDKFVETLNNNKD